MAAWHGDRRCRSGRHRSGAWLLPLLLPLIALHADGTHLGDGNQPPRARFEFQPPQPTTGETITFSDLTSDRDNDIVEAVWDWGDGGIRGGGEPAPPAPRAATHTYARDGTYNVTLNVTDAQGHSDAFSSPVVVSNRPPTASFALTPAYPRPGEEVSFLDTSSDPDGKIVAWLWDFGDGTESRDRDPRHRFAEEAAYTVKLTVTDDAGKRRSTSDVIDIAAAAPARPEESSPIPVELVAGMAGGAALAGSAGIALAFRSNEHFRWRWLLLFSAFYTRLARSEVLDHDVRNAIYTFIAEHPGEHLRQIKRDLGMAHGTLLHHLQMLESQEFVKSVRDGMYRRYYVTGLPMPPVPEDLTDRVSRFLLENPGARNADLCTALRKSPSLIHYHVARLETAGRLRKERAGRHVRLYLVEQPPGGGSAPSPASA